MSRLQSIQNALSSINEAVFQELCDSFLIIRNANYSAFSRTGSQSGKQKTTKGTPDTFLLLQSGKYIFVEYSTNVTAGTKKLQNDIKKCIDFSKTKIPVTQIAEIILCVNFNLNTAEVQSLHSLLFGRRIILTVYTLDSLSLEIHLQHRNLAHQYLGLALDTGQIVSIEKFIAEYNRASNGIATPLDNTFLHREPELKELNAAILNSDFIILSGAPGVGKTKLAIEAIRSYLSENESFAAFCVSYKNHALLDDLYQYFNPENHYLLFVDDANRIDAFNQIIGFYKADRKGKLKIIITVRDYAFESVAASCAAFSAKRINVAKLTDEQLTDIIKNEPFQILNYEYQKVIIQIADGNPRLAIMAALLANAEQNIDALGDVSNLFEKYFSTFVKDDGEFANSINIKSLGIISFFYTIPYKNKELVAGILNNFGIDYSQFIEAVDRLDKLELIEIRFDHLKIPEQNLSTYFFYKAFIKDNLLSFQILLEKYFDLNHKRIQDCVIPANNTFGHKNVMDKLRPILKVHYAAIKDNDKRAFLFLKTFWYYLQSEVLEFLFNRIALLPVIDNRMFKVTYESNAFSWDKNPVLELFGDFFRSPQNLKEPLQLAFEYVRKEPEHMPELIHKIREHLGFDRQDDRFRFLRQNILFDILIAGVNAEDLLYSSAFFELSKTFLSFRFHHTRGGRNNSIALYDYIIPNIESIQEFRRRIWETLDLKFDAYSDHAFDLLKSYARIHPDVAKDVMAFDVPFVLGIIGKHLNPGWFEHCKYVQDQIRWCNRCDVFQEEFDDLTQRFTNSEYEMFLKLDWDRLRDREAYDFDDYEEYSRLKEAEIRASFILRSTEAVIEFYEKFITLKKHSANDYNYANTLDFVIDENCNINFQIGFEILKVIIQNGNVTDYVPRLVLLNQLKLKKKANVLWMLMNTQAYSGSAFWKLSFFYHLDDSLVSKKYAKELVKTISSATAPTAVYFDSLQKYLRVDSVLFQTILNRIVKRVKKGIRIMFFNELFTTHFDKLGDDIELIKKAYIQQDKLKTYFDYNGQGFINILKKDTTFLLEYVKSLYIDRSQKSHIGNEDLGFIWQVEGIESILLQVFDFVIKKEPYLGILDHFCSSFFRNLKGEPREKAAEFMLNYCRANYRDMNRMKVLVEIARLSMSELFEPVLLLFLSLNQSEEDFSKISWRGNSTSGTGDMILADIEAADWRRIQAIVEKSNLGLKLLPVKRYLNDRVEACLLNGDWERQRRFLEH